MNIPALAAELTAGHPDTGAYDADAATAASQLNTVNRSRTNPIASTELLAWSASASSGDRPRIVKIREAAVSHASEQIHAIAIAADLMITRDTTVLDLNLSDRLAMVDALVSGGVLSAADKTSLLGLATETVSRAVELGLGRVRAGDVIQARL